MTSKVVTVNDLDESTYRGLTIHAIPSLHELCMSVIELLSLPASSRVLDLGAGEGAFTIRLAERGFDVSAAELEESRFRLNVPCQNLDLNLEFHDKWQHQFDLVVAIEILEHLHNPRHFIKNCLNLLGTNGYLVVTSPNVESWLSRIRFLRGGQLLWFEENDYHLYGHLTPIFSWQIKQICSELGGELIQVSNTKNSLLRKRLGESVWSVLLNKSFYLSMLSPFMRGRKEGEISVYVIRKGKG